jgi:hypothetical protein
MMRTWALEDSMCSDTTDFKLPRMAILMAALVAGGSYTSLERLHDCDAMSILQDIKGYTKRGITTQLKRKRPEPPQS